MVRKIIQLLTIFVLAIQVSNAQTISRNDQLFIDSLIRSNYSDSLPGVSIIVTMNGNTVYEKSVGMSDIDTKEMLNVNSLMPIGSISKQFGSISLLKLVEQGKVSLDQEISFYLPSYNTHGRKITVANLLSHTSGIPSFTEMEGFGELAYKDLSQDEMTDFFEAKELLFEPSTDWSYTNSGYFLIGRIIETVTGTPYHEFIRNEILLPAGLTNIYLGQSPDAPSYTNGYSSGDGSPKPAREIPWPWTLAAGDIITSVQGLADWENALISGKIISNELLEKARTSYLLDDGTLCNYGFGWATSEIDGTNFVLHGGAIPGFLSQAVSIPGKKIYIAGISNTQSVNPTSIVNMIALRLSGVKLDAPPAANISAEELMKLTGVYDLNRVGGRVAANYGSDKMKRTVTVEDGNLYVMASGGDRTKLIHYGNNRFYTEVNKTRFTFNIGANGNAESISITKYPFQLGPIETSVRLNEELPEEKKEVVITEESVKEYLGTYEVQPGFNLKFLFEDGKFYVQATGQDKAEIFAESDNKYFLKIVDASFEFIKDATGKVTAVSFTQGQTVECKKIE